MVIKKRHLARSALTRNKATVRNRSRNINADSSLKPETKKQIFGLSLITAGIICLLAYAGIGGLAGNWLADTLTSLFGKLWLTFPFFMLIWGTFSFFHIKSGIELKRTFGLIFCLFGFFGLVHLRAPFDDIWTYHSQYGGIIGFMGSVVFFLFASRAVGYVTLSALLLIGIFISFEPDIMGIIRFIFFRDKEKIKTVTKISDNDKIITSADNSEQKPDLIERDENAPELNIVRPEFAKKEISEEKTVIAKNAVKKAARKEEIQMKDTRFEEWDFPELDLLDSSHSVLKVNDEELKKQARQIEEKLLEFGLEVTMRDAHPGPTVTQFTLLPSEGIKLSKIGALKDDLALALAAESLRIEAPIPGKSLVGIEMPNRDRTIVHLREILESSEYKQSVSPLSLPLGRDVSGKAIVAELNDMPHLLIAGATGSGKSVCMNTFLTALLYQNAPDQLKFILIDPKRVELMPYDNIPHLLTPVITEAEKALQALRWCVAEMGRRLHRFSEEGARNIEEYNEKQMEEENVLPRIIVVVDELADLMMRQYRKDTETMIARIAQMARAVGMHLIIATQRPSVDVITGLIKANIPTRIAFRVVSAVDSRTILDSIGAEDLLGRGDMLYQTSSTPKPIRIQGIFVSTKEVERVINAVKIAGGGKMTEQIKMGEDEENNGSLPGQINLEADDNGGDDLFFDAVSVVQETGKASASLLQRRLSVGYARAAKLLDIMEEKGLVSPADGAKPRKVYTENIMSTAA